MIIWRTLSSKCFGQKRSMNQTLLGLCSRFRVVREISQFGAHEPGTNPGHKLQHHLRDCCLTNGWQPSGALGGVFMCVFEGLWRDRHILSAKNFFKANSVIFIAPCYETSAAAPNQAFQLVMKHLWAIVLPASTSIILRKELQWLKPSRNVENSKGFPTLSRN
jgi:hypothetical protein